MIRHERSQTKTIVTLGPASSSKEILHQLIIEGVDVFRLNMSHGAYEDHKTVISKIRELNIECNTRVAILADLQGPKIRVGEMENNGVELKDGSVLKMTTNKCIGTAQEIYINYLDFPKDVKPGEIILLDDGKIRFEVVETNKRDEVKVMVMNGGILSSKKGVNLPDTKVSLPCLTPKDLADLDFALENEVDWIALSFVRKMSDVKELREIIENKGKSVFIIAKIEKPEALTEIDEIIGESDGIMVARGDLGVEASFEKVPIIQKQLIQKCINRGKPVIVATQMLESMITNFRPTRAEANDVANAVIDGADALMLSGETSVGAYPVDSLRSMQKIIDNTEQEGYEYYQKAETHDIRRFLPDAICEAAKKLCDKTNPQALVIFTHSGYTAFRMSSYRPKVPIFVFTDNPLLLSQLSLVWGVRAFLLNKSRNLDESIKLTIEFLKGKNLLKSGNVAIHLASIPLKEKGKTNMIKVCYV